VLAARHRLPALYPF
jgi:putative tryptophan/tyrosine transport system substrate-binding protein